MKTGDRIREAELKEGDFRPEDTMGREKERNTLYGAVYNSRTRLPADFPAIFIMTVLCGV